MNLIVLDDSTVQIAIDGSLYSSDVVHKCFYWFGDKHVVDITFDKGVNLFIVNITAKEGTYSPKDIEILSGKIKGDLIDFKTREIISKETKNIKEILIAKAFSNSDEFDEVPQGSIEDPVGFNPHKI